MIAALALVFVIGWWLNRPRPTKPQTEAERRRDAAWLRAGGDRPLCFWCGRRH